MSKLIQSEPLLAWGFAFALLVAGVAVVFHVTGTPINYAKDTAGVIAPLVVALVARSKVTPMATPGDK
jgi:hypothetical protein